MEILKKNHKYNVVNGTLRIKDGIKFDSLKEMRRYEELKLFERAGKIKYLELQPKYLLLNSFEYLDKKYRATHYIADFRYFDIDHDKTYVEDVKSDFTRKLPVYRLKLKMLLSKYPDINFLEI
jgi:hypothetical protein